MRAKSSWVWALIILLAFLPFVYAYTYRRQIDINTNIVSIRQYISNYQVKVTLDTATPISAGKMKSDCSDIRFRSNSGSDLAYYLEGGCNTASTTFWVKVPSLATSGTTTIWVYYGNSSASSASDPNAVFDFFDDFNSLNTGVWTLNTDSYWGGISVSGGSVRVGSGCMYAVMPFDMRDGYAVDMYVSWGSWYSCVNVCEDSGGVWAYMGSTWSNHYSGWTSNSVAFVERQTASVGQTTRPSIYYVASGSGSSYNNGYESPWLSGGKGTVAYYNGVVKFMLNDAVYKTISMQMSKPMNYILLGKGYYCLAWSDIQDTYYHWVRVRKYVDPEPSVSVGPEEIVDPDSSQSTCSSMGHTWLNNKCCGDDPGETYEAPGAGNGACINGKYVPHDSTSADKKYYVYNGEVHECVRGVWGNITETGCNVIKMGRFGKFKVFLPVSNPDFTPWYMCDRIGDWYCSA